MRTFAGRHARLYLTVPVETSGGDVLAMLDLAAPRQPTPMQQANRLRLGLALSITVTSVTGL